MLNSTWLCTVGFTTSWTNLPSYTYISLWFCACAKVSCNKFCKMNLNLTKIWQEHIHTNKHHIRQSEVTQKFLSFHVRAGKMFEIHSNPAANFTKRANVCRFDVANKRMSIILAVGRSWQKKKHGKTVQQEFSHHLNSITKWHLGFYQGRLIEYLHGISFLLYSSLSLSLSLFCSFVWFCLAVMPIFVVVHITPMRAALSSLFICFAFRMAWRHIIWKFSNYFTKCRMAKSFSFNSSS